MRKSIIFLFMALVLLNLNLSFANSNWVELELKYDGKIHNYKAKEVHIKIDNQEITEYAIPPIILESYTLVPLRSVFEKMGATVIWNEDQRKVTITRDLDEVEVYINSDVLIKNKNNEIKLDIPAKIINDYTMLPLRAIAQAFDCTVNWNNVTRTINIYQKDFDLSQIEQQDDSIEKKDGIKIVWDQISNVYANSLESKRKPIEGLDVLSPTWFDIINNNGDITDNGSLEYANWAKQQGYQLWGLVTNSFNTEITHNTLSNPEIRTKIINKLCELADKYSLDGINIDFENVGKNDGDYYLQFIKEATKKFKEKNLIVSVDMYIPSPWTAHYQMAEVGKIVDYVIIMAYDEHYSGSKESGSVSSINWVDAAMANAVKLVDKDKLIMGVPFYTRVWSEQKNSDGTVNVTSKSLTMTQARELLEQNNADIVWLEETGQYYGEYVEDGITKKIWLEDERSMEERMKIARKYDVKGIAAWKRGHEKDEVWNVINKYYD